MLERLRRPENAYGCVLWWAWMTAFFLDADLLEEGYIGPVGVAKEGLIWAVAACAAYSIPHPPAREEAKRRWWRGAK